LIPTDFFNVLDSKFESMTTETFADARVEGRILYQAPDRRQLVIATRYPEGVAFEYGGSVDYHEAFYVSSGSGVRTFPDGNAVPMREGDLIYVRPGVEISYLYGPGFSDVAFFWSDAELSPDLVGGLSGSEVGGDGGPEAR
jgi:mannose-6-phosphate isomerase-like protein (cupin superfamily)